jgi:hypothetical protein
MRTPDADDGESRRQSLIASEVVNRGEQLALREITGRAEDDERRGSGCRLDAQPVL